MFSQGKIDSHYASVTQTSGIGAGSGGYAISVGGNTDLKGAVIASTADPSLNVLSTGTLTTSDIQNKASYSASQMGISASYSSGGGFCAMPSLSVPQGDDSHSITQAGIAAGTVDIRNHPTQDLSGLDRNPTLGATGIQSIFDVQKVQTDQQLGQVAGYVGMRAAGDVEQTQHWVPGSAQAIALHTVVGAATAALGGGNALQGALGAGAGEAANNVQLATNPTEQRLLGAGVGALVGGGTGAATALDGTIYNDQHHFTNYLGELAACQKAPSGSGCGTILAMQGDRSVVLSTADSSNPNGVIANIESQTGQVVSYTITNAQGQPTLIMQPSDYQNYLAIVGTGSNFYNFIGSNSPEYALQGSNAVTDVVNGQGAKAIGNFVGMFTNGAYWRDMGIGMTAVVGTSLPSNVTVGTTDATASGAMTASSPVTTNVGIASASADAEAGGATQYASNLPAQITGQFNMVSNPGPLTEMAGNPAANFAGGQYTAMTTTENITLYRGGDSNGSALGQWYTTSPPTSVAQVRIDSAVKPQWIDSVTGGLTGTSPVNAVYQISVPAGTTIYQGPVASQGGVYVGGSGPAQMQIFIPKTTPGLTPVGVTPIH